MKLVENRNRNINMLSSVVTGDAVATIIYLLAALSCPFFLLNGMIEETSIKIIVNFVQGVGAFIGALIAGKIVNKKKWISSILSTGIIFFFLIICAALFFEVDSGAVIGGLFSVAFGGVCAIFLTCRKRNLNKKRSKRRSC